MTAPARRWKSTSGESAGDELICRPLLPEELKAALRPALQSGHFDGAFLLARLASSDHAGICAAIRAISELKSKIHISLAIDLATLERLDSTFPATESTGLVLDGVNATTPLSALILDSIEAIRFEGAFTAAASRSLRIDAALRAMLFLANDLALGTFASEAAPSSYLLSPRPTFDYVLGEDAAPIVVRARKTRPIEDDLLKTSGRGR
jgi:hypothetical protein